MKTMLSSLFFVIVTQYIFLTYGLFLSFFWFMLGASVRVTSRFLLECFLLLCFLCSVYFHGLGLGESLQNNPVRLWALERAYYVDRSGSIAVLLFAAHAGWNVWYRSVMYESGLIHIWVASGQHLYHMRKCLRRLLSDDALNLVLAMYVFVLCGGSLPLVRAWCDQALSKTYPKEERCLWAWYLLLCCGPDRAFHPSLWYSVWMAWWLHVRRAWPREQGHIYYSIDAWIGMLFPLWALGIRVHPLGWFWDRVWGPWIIYLVYPILWLMWCVGSDRLGVLGGLGLARLVNSMDAAQQLCSLWRPLGPSLVAVVLVGGVMCRSYRKHPWRIVACVLLLGCTQDARSSYVRVFDVGRGQSILSVHQGSAVLLDTGDKYAARRVARYLFEHQIRLDAILISHGDQDHMGGLSSLRVFLKDPKNIWAPKDSMYLHFPIKHYGYQFKTCYAGLSMNWGGASWRVLHPQKDEPYQGNASSCVWLWEGEGTWLFPGDITTQVEKTLMSSTGQVDVLVLAHHGSLGSNHADWLAHLKPQCLVASVHQRVWHRRGERMKERMTSILPDSGYYVTAGTGDLHITLPPRPLSVHGACSLKVEYDQG